jgi:outer membrane protein
MQSVSDSEGEQVEGSAFDHGWAGPYFHGHMATQWFGTRAVLLTTSVSGLLLAGCSSGPLSERSTQELRAAVREAVDRELLDAKAHPDRRVIARADSANDLGLSERVREQLDRDYNPDRYLEGMGSEGSDKAEIADLLSDDLFGNRATVVGIALERAVRSGIGHNLDVEIARFGPALRESDVVAAQAAFDWAFVSSLDWEDTDQPRGSISLPGFGGGGVVISSRQTVNGAAGLERTFVTGGKFKIEQRYLYSDNRPTFFGSVPSPNPATAASLVMQLDQPLLRGFGSDIGLAEIRIAENAERRAIAQLEDSLIGTATSIEDAYWDLVKAHRDLVILTKLLKRGEKVRDDIRVRQVLDADPAQVADAIANVERRRADVLRAQRAVRAASDLLKVLMNDPRLPVGGEIVLKPTDTALDQPIEFSLIDAMTTAIEHRPDIRQAILGISDASVREVIARNARLPQLDLKAQLTLVGLGEGLDDSTTDMYQREFIDNFLLGLLLRQPLGNRAGEAGFRRSRLERMQSVVSYRKAVQNAIAEVRAALDDVVTNYRLIDQAKTSRVAAAEALRTLLVKKELGQGGYTVERLNLELSQQQSLASAERAEIAALLDYNRAVARLHLAMGTALDRNRINFVVPDANQLLVGESAAELGR